MKYEERMLEVVHIGRRPVGGGGIADVRHYGCFTTRTSGGFPLVDMAIRISPNFSELAL